MPPRSRRSSILALSVVPSLALISSMLNPWKWAYVFTTFSTLGSTVSDTSTVSVFLVAAIVIMAASAVAVEPSYIEALDTSMPVSSAIMLWYSKI